MHAKALASNRLARANRARHGPRVRAKERAKNVRENIKEKSKGAKGAKRTKGAKGSHKGKTSTTGLSSLEKSKSEKQARKLRNLHRRVPLTILGFMLAEVMMNGMIVGVTMNG